MKRPAGLWIGATLLLIAAAVVAWWLTAHLPTTAAADELAPVPGDALVTFARIQSELNRAAAGRPPRPPEAGADALEGLGEALRSLLAGNTTRAAHALDGVETEIARRIPTDQQAASNPLLAEKAEWLVSYFELLPSPPSGRTVKLETAGFVRLALDLRKVDALLLADILPGLRSYDLVARRVEGERSVFEGMGLRFPCRVAENHRPALEETAKRLRKLAGALTDCPLPPGHDNDFTLMERIARDPTIIVDRAPEGKPATPRDLRTRLMTVAATGTLEQIAAALRAGADPQRADARGRTALHYLLGNPKVDSADRAEAIRLLY